MLSKSQNSAASMYLLAVLTIMPCFYQVVKGQVTAANRTIQFCKKSLCVNGYFENTPDFGSMCVVRDDGSLPYTNPVGNILKICNGTTQAFVPFSNYSAQGNFQYPPVFSTTMPCFGNLNFTIAGTVFWLNGTDFLRLDGAGNWYKYATTDAGRFRYYLARFRQKETTTGFAFCYSMVMDYYYTSSEWNTRKTWRAFYFTSGSYFAVETDSMGTLLFGQQLMQPYFYMLSPIVIANDLGCYPACCWYQDYSSEFFFNGTNGIVMRWNGYSYDSNSYTALSTAMGECMLFMSTLDWHDNGKRYGFTNGVISQLDPFTGDVIGSSTDIDPDKQSTYLQNLDSDPLARGGVYFMSLSTTNAITFRNASGDYTMSFNVNNGTFAPKQRKMPECTASFANRNIYGTAEPSCSSTPDVFQATQYHVCDPKLTTNPCGSGYVCRTIPSSLGLSSCQKGVCVPDYYSPAICTSTASLGKNAIPTNLARYGRYCNANSDCYTGICSNNFCSCSRCTQVLPTLQWDWKANATVYGELCIPKTSSIGGPDDYCNMWAAVPSAACGFPFICAKCPEVWNSVGVNATCVAPTLPAAVKGNLCPSTYKCNYKANCTLFQGQPTCTCPPGYNLASNMVDCYGWIETNRSACSVTCGNNGTQTLTRYCDKPPSLIATCNGDPVTLIPCSPMPPQCPLPLNAIDVSVVIKFYSTIITAEMFEEEMASYARTLIAKAISQKCIADKSTFQTQCCPGRSYVAGITATDCINSGVGVEFLSEYTNGQMFLLTLLVKGDASSSCCKAAPLVSGKRKRDISTVGAFDQTILADIITTSPTLLADLTSLARFVDPNADVRTTVSRATSSTTTTTTTTTPNPNATNTTVSSSVVSSTVSSTSNTVGGLQIWIIGAVGGGGGLIIVVAIIVIVVLLVKKNKNNKVHHRFPHEHRGSKPSLEMTRQKMSAERNKLPSTNDLMQQMQQPYDTSMNLNYDMSYAQPPPLQDQQLFAQQQQQQQQQQAAYPPSFDQQYQLQAVQPPVPVNYPSFNNNNNNNAAYPYPYDPSPP